MKYLSTSVCVLLLMVLSLTATAQQKTKNTIETTFEVKGVCNMCKKRIENAAYGKGVKLAEWNKETGILTLVYKSSKTSEKAVHQRIADAGHSTEEVAADKESYEQLPKCCSYHDGVKKH